jgi:hypothetical protein
MQLLRCQLQLVKQHSQLGMDKQQSLTAISMAAAATSTMTHQHSRSRFSVQMSAGEAQEAYNQLGINHRLLVP